MMFIITRPSIQEMLKGDFYVEKLNNARQIILKPYKNIEFSVRGKYTKKQRIFYYHNDDV